MSFSYNKYLQAIGAQTFGDDQGQLIDLDGCLRLTTLIWMDAETISLDMDG